MPRERKEPAPGNASREEGARAHENPKGGEIGELMVLYINIVKEE